MKVWSIIIPAALFFACNGSGSKTGDSTTVKYSDTASFEPAVPAAKISVVFPADQDTTRITIRFEIDNQSKVATFELPLARDVSEGDLYRLIWDKPNSCYIGVMKTDHSKRYYHASVDNGNLKILQVTTPPQFIWHYAEEKAGLGTVTLAMKPVQEYRQNLTSGKIVEDLIVKMLPSNSPDTVRMYAEFGGASKTIAMPVLPEAKAGIIHSATHPEQAFLVMSLNKRYTNLVEIIVIEGHLQVTKLQ